jgi:hypothetical protein
VRDSRYRAPGMYYFFLTAPEKMPTNPAFLRRKLAVMNANCQSRINFVGMDTTRNKFVVVDARRLRYDGFAMKTNAVPTNHPAIASMDFVAN